MSGNKKSTGSVKSRHTRTYKVAPVARAVRVALAISVTAMAMSGSSLVFAGTCTPPSSNTVYCDGSFLNTITFPDVDLTLVVGQNAPTSVTPGAGLVGIEANWPGNVNVTSYADITTNGGDGIHAYGSTSAQVVNRGSIHTTASVVGPPPAPTTDGDTAALLGTPGAIAIDAVAYGNVTVINSGYAGTFGTGVYDVTAVLAESTGTGYTATVYNQSSGAIIAFTDGSGTALGIFGQATNGDVNVTNNGLLVAVSYYGIADGVFADGQSVNVSNSNSIYGITAIGSSWGAGIEAQGSDLTTVSNSGSIYAVASAAYGHAFGVYATSGAGGTTVYNSGTVDVRGPYATGIEAQSNGGSVNVRNNYGGNLVIGNSFTTYFATGISAATSYANSNISIYNGGSITALSHYGSTGIQAVATGAGSTVNATNLGDIYVNTSGKYASMGIVVSGDGNSSIYSRGGVTVAYGGNSTGLEALSFNGTAGINNVGKVDVTAAPYVGNGHGLVASSANGAARVYNSGTVTVTAGYYGFGIEASGMTQARVSNSGTVTVNAKYGYGIFASSGAGYVNVYNGASGNVGVTSTYGTALGIVGLTTQGDISLGNAGTVSATGYSLAIGIFGRADAGNVSVGNNGNLYATSYLGPAIALEAIATTGNASANAGANSNIVAYSNGNTAIGIDVQAPAGNATVYNAGDITVTAGQDANARNYSGALGIADGIFATGQNVSVRSGGTISATGYGWAAGIEAQATNLTQVNNYGTINATSTGAYSHAFGVYATGGTGGVNISNSGAVNVQGSYAIGIDAQAQGGGISIVNTGDIIVGNTNRTYYATGISAATNYAGSNVYAYSNGSVTALSYFGSTGIAMVATGAGSNATVRNAGDVYVNTAGKYASTGIIVSGDGNATIGNSGSVTVAYGGNSYGAVALAFNGNANVSNTGNIDVTAAILIGSGYGIVSSSANGAAYASNSSTGTITVNAGYYGFGIQDSGLTAASVSNYGSINVDAKYGYGVLASSGQGNVRINNSGAGSVTVNSKYATAMGLGGISTQGYTSINNSGSVSVTGYTGAIGIFARANAGDAGGFNSGDITASSYLGAATGILAHATGGNSRAYNSYGDITVTSDGNNAIGMESLSDGGVAIANNTGTITVSGGQNGTALYYSGALGIADGIFASGDSVYARNGGAITATGYGWAAGIEAQGDTLTRVYNTGTIIATSTGDNSHAFGIYATSGASGLSVYNGGDITAMGPYATGIQAQASGTISIDNRGDITVGDANTTYFANGINASTNYANANIFIGNTGSVTANSYYGSTGIAAVATGPGSTGSVANGGSVYVNTTGKYNSMGIVVSADGNANIYTTGASSVTVHYGGNSYGEVALSFNGTASVNNNGDVTVNGAALVGNGYGIIASSANGSASVSNSGGVTVYGGYTAMGIQAGCLTGVSVGNSGAVAVDTFKYGYGILATSGAGNVQIYNAVAGSVDVYSYAGSALGITGIATLGDVTIYNNGSVSASGYTNTIGIFARANAGNVTVGNNAGSITAFNYISPAIGILAIADAGNVNVGSGGSITVTSLGEAAIGIQGQADNGTVNITNSGDITVAGGTNAAALYVTGALGLADGIFGSGQTVRVNNASGGNINATGYGWAAGIEAQGSNYTSVNNSGSITATSTAAYSHAFGIYATSGAAGLFVNNYGGDITVLGSYATGIQAQSTGDIFVGNSGSITVGDAATSYYATGISAATNYAGSDILVRNDGGVTVNSYFGSTGIAAVATGPGSNITVINGGDVYVNTAGKYASMGIVASADGNTNVYTTGSITVAYGGNSYGAVSLAFNGNASLTNRGDVNVTAAGLIGNGYGLIASSANASASVYNSGSVTVYGGYYSFGIQASGLTGVNVNNSGSVTSNTFKYGYGILATSGQGDVNIGNSGSVDVYSYAISALGITGIATLGNVSIYNSGSVSASGYTNTIGIFARANDGNVFVNSANGSITAFTYIAPAIGVLAHATGGNATVYNGSAITATSLGEAAIGIDAVSDTGAVNVSNSGDITVIADASPAVTAVTGAIGAAYGILGVGQTVNVGSSGNIDATGYAFAAGIDARGVDFTSVGNSGSIHATTSRAYSGTYGARVLSGGDANVTNSGDIYAVSTGTDSHTFGVLVQAYGNVNVYNTGSVSATGYSDSTGVLVLANGGNVGMNHNGDVLATTSVGPAVGVLLNATGGNVSMSGNGSTTAISQAGPAVGIQGVSDVGSVVIDLSGDVTATSTLGNATGIAATGQTAYVFSSGDINVYGNARATGIQAYGVNLTNVNNSGAISATTTGADAATYGALVLGNASVFATNSGSITATSAGANSDTFGLFAQSVGNLVVNNSGTISSVSNGANSNTVGVLAQANGTVSVTNSGTITATDPLYAVAVSLNSGAYSVLRNTSTGIITTYAALEGNIAVLGGNGFENILNYGYIHGAIVTNGGIDQLFNGNGGLWLVDNHSTDFGDGDDIASNATGGTIRLTDGAITLGAGNDTLNNGGLIQATGSTIGLGDGDDVVNNIAGGTVQLTDSAMVLGAGNDTLNNGGLIQATNSTVTFGDGNDTVNDGAGSTIQLTDSAMYLGAGNDTINNSGSILLSSSAIYLGDGDDAINNNAGGLIQLTDSAIYFEAGAGNSFANNGVIRSFGDSLIDMGTGGAPPDSFAPTAVPSLNTIPLVNNGVISFLDGAPDDTLTIVGDLGGNGSLNIDVSLINNTSDMLYVDGSVISNSVQTVNVAFDQFPTTAISLIPFAHVTGNSMDGNFVSGGFAAGNVLNLDPSNFISMQVGIVSQIDPTNASDDIFSIGLEVSGLNDTGVLAASVASGVQSLVNSQIGTWRQRMGVLPDKGEHASGLSPWVRSFTDKGEVDPAHVAANFPQGGNFRYDQSNSGQEVGMNVNPGTRGFNFGLLVNKSEGSQHLVNPGVGSDRIRTNAVGLYGTWISPNGWYLDLSHRWINFDAVLRSAAGERQTKGYASAWNVEAGYDAWTLSGGMKITPQAQYTRTRVGNIDDVQGNQATFVANGGDSSRGRLGVLFSKTIDSDSGFTWTPYGSVNAVREFNGKTTYAINNAFFGSTNVEGTSAMVELGLGAQKGGFSVTGGVNWTDGGALQSFKGGQLELRYTW